MINDANAQPNEVLIIFQEIAPGNAGRAGKLLTPPNVDNLSEEE